MGEVVEIERCALAKLIKSTDLCDQARKFNARYASLILYKTSQVNTLNPHIKPLYALLIRRALISL
jgi:hypothetical protein